MKIRLISPLAAAAALAATPAWAQHMERSSGIEGFLDRLDGGQLIGALAVTLIFGTGMVAVLTSGLASIIKAYNGSPEDDALAERLEGLEGRLAQLEQQLATRRESPLDATVAR